jgi:GWxTD domain-containing protein
MLPEEQKQVRKLDSTREAVAFIEEFWRRRDPDPASPGNEFSRSFYERVEAADRLYSEGATRGSLTDRGRALILLGAPPRLHYGQKAVPTWEPGRPGSRPNVQARNIVVETWAYTLADLPPDLVKLIEEESPVTEVILAFAVETRRTYLIEGKEFLDLAVRAAVRE